MRVSNRMRSKKGACVAKRNAVNTGNEVETPCNPLRKLPSPASPPSTGSSPTTPGREYTAYFDADDERVAVVYAVDGVWAGQGRWIADSGETVDCGAVIPDVVYAALDVGLRAQLAAQ